MYVVNHQVAQPWWQLIHYNILCGRELVYVYTVLLEKLHNMSSVFKWLYAKCVSCQLCFLWHHICKLTWICTLNTDQSYYLELSNSHKLLIALYSMCRSVYCSCVPWVHVCVHSNIVSSPPSPFLPLHLLFSYFLPSPPPLPPACHSLHNGYSDVSSKRLQLLYHPPEVCSQYWP